MKYLIYKVSGGLNHMLGQINNAIHLSKTLNRFLIIDCNYFPFENDFNKYINIPNFNYSTNYDCLYQDSTLNKDIFEPYIKANCKNYADSQDSYWLNDKIININACDNNILKSNKKIIYCSWIDNGGSWVWDGLYAPWYIKVNENIVNMISKNKIYYNYIGVHYRNTDMKHDFCNFIPEILKLFAKFDTVYLATDDYYAYDKFYGALSNKFNIIQYTKPCKIPTGKTNIHYGNINKDEVITDALIDMYHLIYSTRFIPSWNSCFSQRIMNLRDKITEKDKFFY
jgi:hypothetical protein